MNVKEALLKIDLLLNKIHSTSVLNNLRLEINNALENESEIFPNILDELNKLLNTKYLVSETEVNIILKIVDIVNSFEEIEEDYVVEDDVVED